MKRLPTIMLVLCMVISIMPTAFASEATELVIENPRGTVVASYTNGINNGDAVDSILGGTTTAMRTGGEWLSWDISSLAEGAYELKMDMAMEGVFQGQLKIYVDDVLNLVYQHNEDDGSYTASEHTIGTIAVPTDAKQLKIKNDSLYTNISIAKITLTKKGNIETASDDVTLSAAMITTKTDYTDEIVNGVYPGGARVIPDTDYHIENSNFEFRHNYFQQINTSSSPSACLRTNDWGRYDIKGLKSGTYNLKAYLGTDDSAQFLVIIDDANVLKTTVENTGSYARKTVDLGQVYIEDGAEFLKLKLLTSAAYIDTFTLEYVSASDVTSQDTEPYVISYPRYSAVASYTNGINNSESVDSINGGGSAAMRQGGEWIAWDVSTLISGVYELKMDMAMEGIFQGQLKIYVDDVLNYVYQHNEDDGSYTETEHIIGTVEIPKGAKQLKIKNDSLYTCISIAKITMTRTGKIGDKLYSLTYSAPMITTKTDYTDEIVNGVYPGGARVIPDTDYHIENSNFEFRHNYFQQINTSSSPSACLRTNDWSRYDIKGLKSGTYNLKAYLGTGDIAEIEILIDEESALKTNIENTGSYARKTVDLGQVYIEDGAEFLKLKLLTSAAYINTFTLEYVTPVNTSPAYSKSYTYLDLLFANSNYSDSKDDYTKGDFYDTSGNNTIQTSAHSVVINTGEWFKFDVSAVPAGVYKFTSNTTVADSGTLVIVKAIDIEGNILDEDIIEIDGTGSYKGYISYIPALEMPEGTTNLIMESQSGTVIIDSFTLEGTIAVDVEFTSDKVGFDEVFVLGNNTTVYAQLNAKSSMPGCYVDVITAVYEGNRLVDVDIYEDLLINKNNEVKEAYKISIENGQSIKVFVWSDITSLSAIGGVTSIS